MPNAAPEPVSVARTGDAMRPEFNVVLKPISPPGLDDIRIDDNLFAIGRTEAPFVSYDPAIVADLSRRHARIFSEFGGVYIADLDSKNGTTVNGVPVRQKPSRLNDGDEIGLGRSLSFRVHLSPRQAAPAPAARLLGLTLTPEHADLGLEPIAITRFPFLVSKTDPVFARYKEKFPHQINYISRRHAHLFLKNGRPYVEDLGSTNGTFVGGQRLDEHAVAVRDGDLLAFGGHQLAYRVSLQQEVVSEPTATRLSLVPPSVAATPGDGDKTTFLAAADSFLDIFCIDHSPQEEDELNKETQAPADDGVKEAAPHGRRQKAAYFLAELKSALASHEPRRDRWIAWRIGAVAAGVAAVLTLAVYLGGTPERDVKVMLTDGDYAGAASAARQALADHPDNQELKALGTEALLKANLPGWLAAIKAGDFAEATAAVARMRELATDNAEARPLVDELAWLGELEQFVAARGKGEAPIRIYADEDRIATLLKTWDEDPQKHQRAFTAMAAHVPAFREGYAESLSHLRKLQSDDAVYLAAIERLKAAVVSELERDHPEALAAVFEEYAEKYPRLGGLDSLRQDLRQYLRIDSEARAGNLGPLVALLASVKFATPPFQERLRALAASGRLPSAEVLAQYQAAATAWRAGDSQAALDGLQKMATGPWAEGIAGEIARKKAVVDQFAELQKARGGKDYDQRLLAFYGLLEADEDVHFIRATEADLDRIREPALKQAQELLDRAEAAWRRYRDNGSIDSAQRLEATVSTAFRAQARLLDEAQAAAEQGRRIHVQLKVDFPEARQAMWQEIDAEVALQRNSLLELRAALDPAVLKAKLALIGGRHGEERQSP